MSSDQNSSDVRVLPRDFIRQFIALYKSFPCLWKIKHETYNNRRLRDEAYRKIAEFCKERGFSDANRDFVSRKIQSLRGSFRKEMRRIKKTGYETSLWYFDLLKFTVEQEEGGENRDKERENRRYFDQEDEIGNDNGASNHSASNNAMFLGDDDRDGKHDDDDDDDYGVDDNVFEDEPDDPPEEYEVPKKKRHLSTTKRNKTITEFEAIGINVARKLERMDSKQAIYAESVINSVLKKGLFGKLSENDSCDGECRGLFASTTVANPLDVDALGMKREQ